MTAELSTHPDQAPLRRWFLSSLERRGWTLDQVARFEGGRWRLLDLPGEIHAIAVLRSFDLAPWVRETAAFLATLDRDLLARWDRSFTKTLFLVGAPEKVAPRYPGIVAHRAEDVAWVRPGDGSAHLGLRRLLKPLRTGAPLALARAVEVSLPGPPSGRHRRIRVTTGEPLERFLVHLNHTLAEGWIHGALGPGDVVVVEPEPALAGLPEPCLGARVHLDPGDPLALKLYSTVTEGSGVHA